MQEQDKLIQAAREGRERAHAPYSNFQVGAAVEAEDGEIYIGCNVESASYGLTVCAERVAIWKGVSSGSKRFSQIAVVVDTDDLTPPCGACRQILWEFAPDSRITLANMRGRRRHVRMSTLLPSPFDSRDLDK